MRIENIFHDGKLRKLQVWEKSEIPIEDFDKFHEWVEQKKLEGLRLFMGYIADDSKRLVALIYE